MVAMPRPKNPTIRETRQQQILLAARTIFATQGLAEARMDDVAQRCGLSKGTLYLYYKNKDDLIAGLLESTFNDLLIQLQALVDLEHSTKERLLIMTQQMIAYLQQDTSTLNIAYEFYAVASRQPAVRAFLKDYFAAYRRILATLLEQGITRCEYPVMDTDQPATLLIAVLEGLTLLWFTAPDSIHLDILLPQAIQHIFST